MWPSLAVGSDTDNANFNGRAFKAWFGAMTKSPTQVMPRRGLSLIHR